MRKAKAEVKNSITLRKLKLGLNLKESCEAMAGIKTILEVRKLQRELKISVSCESQRLD